MAYKSRLNIIAEDPCEAELSIKIKLLFILLILDL